VSEILKLDVPKDVAPAKEEIIDIAPHVEPGSEMVQNINSGNGSQILNLIFTTKNTPLKSCVILHQEKIVSKMHLPPSRSPFVNYRILTIKNFKNGLRESRDTNYHPEHACHVILVNHF